MARRGAPRAAEDDADDGGGDDDGGAAGHGRGGAPLRLVHDAAPRDGGRLGPGAEGRARAVPAQGRDRPDRRAARRGGGVPDREGGERDGLPAPARDGGRVRRRRVRRAAPRSPRRRRAASSSSPSARTTGSRSTARCSSAAASPPASSRRTRCTGTASGSRVKNRYAAPVAVKLLDLVPVSRDEKIEVKLLEGTTAATREDPERPGVRICELSLAAREEKVVELRYEVRYPRGFPIAGLEWRPRAAGRARRAPRRPSPRSPPSRDLLPRAGADALARDHEGVARPGVGREVERLAVPRRREEPAVGHEEVERGRASPPAGRRSRRGRSVVSASARRTCSSVAASSGARARSRDRNRRKQRSLSVSPRSAGAEIGIDLGEDRLAHPRRLLVAGHRPVVGEQPAARGGRGGCSRRDTGPIEASRTCARTTAERAGARGVDEGLVGVGGEEAAAQDRERRPRTSRCPSRAGAGATGSAARSPPSRAARRGRSRDGRAGRRGGTSATR